MSFPVPALRSRVVTWSPSGLAHRLWPDPDPVDRLWMSNPVRAFQMVLLRWDLHGERFEERVPWQWARRRRHELEQQGAVVYWSERLAAAA